MSVMKILEETGAFLKGHFLLSSGLHSDSYIQCAKALIWPDKADIIAGSIYDLISDFKPDLIVSPALGGIIIGWEVSRKFQVPFMFAEREDGVMKLRRGFEIRKGTKVIVVEDVFTTGRSTLETVSLVRAQGGEVIAAAAIAERGNPSFDFPHYSAVKIDLITYTADLCPMCRAGIELIKPGSRKII